MIRNLRRCVPVLVALVAACGSSPGEVVIDARWSPGTALPVPLANFGVAVHRGAIYVAGGDTDAGGSTAVYRFRPGDAAWQPLAELPDARSGTDLVVVGDSLFAVGGSHVAPGNAYSLDRRMWVNDPGADAWHARADLPDARDGTAVAAQDRIVVVGGGFGSPEHGGTFPGDSVAVYLPASGRWSYAAPIPSPRNRPMAVLVDGRIHVFGGRAVGAGLGAEERLEIYDPAADAWSSAGRLDTDLTFLTNIAYAVVGRRVHFFGGFVAAPGGGISGLHRAYDLDQGSWERLPPLPTPRGGARAVALDGRLYVIGGFHLSRLYPQPISRAVEVYTP